MKETARLAKLMDNFSNLRLKTLPVMRMSFAAAAALASILVVTSSFAQAPDSLSFQGYLTDELGNPISQAGLSMTFKLYDGGIDVWSETQSVDVSEGVYHVLLGSVSALDTLAFKSPLELGVTVGGDSEMSPRVPLAAAAFAKALPGLYTSYAEASTIKSYNVVGGAENNVLGGNVTGATIGGGGGFIGASPVPNSVLANHATVGGGSSNTASGATATVGGGQFNMASGTSSTVAGGFSNTATGSSSAVGGGQSNVANNLGTVGGGESNVASGPRATVGGGDSNKATGSRSTVPGGLRNTADGTTAFAAGYLAAALHDGAFVWQDDSAGPFDTLKSAAQNQFHVRASGGLFFYTGAAPDLATGVSLPAGTGSWIELSSETSKTNFSQVDARSYLDGVVSLELKQWSYRTEEGVTHVGPMSEDFYAAFGHGPTDKGISGVDADGVALAAIQGLYELVKEQRTLIDRQTVEIERMRGVLKRAGLE